MDILTQGYTDLVLAANLLLVALDDIENGKTPRYGSSTDDVLFDWPSGWAGDFSEWTKTAEVNPNIDTEQESKELAVFQASIQRHAEHALKVYSGQESVGGGGAVVIGDGATPAKPKDEAGGVAISGGNLLMVAGFVVAGIIAYLFLKGRKK